MDWTVKSFHDLTVEELYQILKLRVNTFILEQRCFYKELDDLDQRAFHLFLKNKREVIAYCRLLPSNTRYKEASIGRVIVNGAYRNQGYARRLMDLAITYIQINWAEKEIKIQAQTYLQSFYSSFGFKPVTSSYVEDGIPHIDMILKSP